MNHSIDRRQALAILASSMAAQGALAQQSSTPLRWLVGYPAGGGADVQTRMIAQQLSTKLGRPVIVDNRPGVGGSLAAQALAQAAPDGNTLMTIDNSIMVFNGALFKKPPYDAERDFKSVGTTLKVPFILCANVDSKHKSIQTVVDLMRREPGKVNYATPGMASPHNLAMEMLKDKAKLDAVAVHYKGGAPAIQDVLGGQIEFIILDGGTAQPLLKAGKLKVLGTFSKLPLPAAPEAPSIINLGYTDVEVEGWGGAVVSSATPEPIRIALSEQLKSVIQVDSVQKTLREMGVEPMAMTGPEMDARAKLERQYWIPLIRSRGISVD